MAAPFLVLSLAAIICFAQPGSCRPEKGSTPKVEDIVKEVQTSINKVIDDAKKALNLPNDPNGEAIVKALKEQAGNAEKAFDDMKKKIEDQIKSNPQIQEVVKTLETKIEDAKSNIKKENPEVAANAQKALDQIKAAYGSINKEVEKINTEVNKKGGLKDDIESLLENIIDRSRVAIKDLSAKLEEATKKN